MNRRALSLALDLISQPVFVVDSAARVQAFNRAATQHFGAPLIGQEFLRFLGDRALPEQSAVDQGQSDWARLSKLTLRSLKGGDYSLSATEVGGMGGAPWLLLRCLPARSCNRRRKKIGQKILSLVEELRQREQQESRLSEEKDRVQVTLEAIGDAVICCDTRGRVEYLNPAASLLTGWPGDHAIGKPLGQVLLLIDGESRQRLLLDPDALKAQQASGESCERRLLQHNGRELPIEYSIEPIRSNLGVQKGYVVVCRDISEFLRLRQHLEYEASHDVLTGLANRRELERQIDRLRQQKQGRQSHWLLFVDLDRFKQVNDSAGHAAGDLLLQQIAERMRNVIRCSDTLARIGGDEFVVLLAACPATTAEALAESLRQSISSWVLHWQGQAHQVGASVGLLSFRGDHASSASLMAAADAACYAAKQAGRDQVRMAQPKAAKRADPSSSRILQALQSSLQNNRLQLSCQPLISVRDGRVIGAAELRLQVADGHHHWLKPAEFRPVSRRHGLSSALDEWILQQAWSKLGSNPTLTLHMDLCAESALAPEFQNALFERLQQDTQRAQRLCLELSEMAIVTQPTAMVRFMRKAIDCGARLAVDHCRGGLGSIELLRRLPLHLLKLHRTLIKRLQPDGIDLVLITALAQVAGRLGLQCVACDVDQQQQLDLLRGTAVAFAQGSLFGPETPLDLPTEPPLRDCG